MDKPISETLRIAINLVLFSAILLIIVFLSGSAKTLFNIDNERQAVKKDLAVYRDLYQYDNKTLTGDEVLTAVRKYSRVLDMNIQTGIVDATPLQYWFFNGTTNNFANGATTISPSAQGLRGVLSSYDGSFYSPAGLNIPLTGNEEIDVSVKNNSVGTAAQIYFATSVYNGITEATSRPFTMTANDTNYIVYKITMSGPNWGGTLNQLRFDLANGANSGDFYVDSIKLMSLVGSNAWRTLGVNDTDAVWNVDALRNEMGANVAKNYQATLIKDLSGSVTGLKFTRTD
jgi:hypothetical protein